MEDYRHNILYTEDINTHLLITRKRGWGEGGGMINREVHMQSIGRQSIGKTEGGGVQEKGTAGKGERKEGGVKGKERRGIGWGHKQRGGRMWATRDGGSQRTLARLPATLALMYFCI